LKKLEQNVPKFAIILATIIITQDNDFYYCKLSSQATHFIKGYKEFEEKNEAVNFDGSGACLLEATKFNEGINF